MYTNRRVVTRQSNRRVDHQVFGSYLLDLHFELIRMPSIKKAFGS